ncbi:SDR family oxidoreductase [Sphingobacterium thalpophilum]|uniref:3-oxoacyl-[acyl-carrier-protein] reductase FabG n=1 Tax=Sphingobacterium thalpophilum TaxID=259 RepID=A0A4U9VQV4_9SPHI|nr:SDR family oxidoreductase [Sphingobacterium thalpophilum]VTR49775.1 3-oxoacyl-[acyl-carrier-protein] reductase FabG [Sphingobacterium thalpophilum]
MKNLKNKIALITGGNSGIGFETAKAFVTQGATTIITGRRKEAIIEAADTIGAIPLVADQSLLSDIDRLAAEVKERYGKLDILFINAGITGEAAMIADAREETFDSVMDINLKGAYFTLSRFIPLLQDGASVIFLSSNVASMNMPQSSIYQASKAALNTIAKTAALELAERKIRVNTVSPGPTRTQVLNKSYDPALVDGIWESLAGTVPLKKIGKPEDVAAMVVYLASESATFITGSDFVLDGGMKIS